MKRENARRKPQIQPRTAKGPEPVQAPVSSNGPQTESLRADNGQAVLPGIEAAVEPTGSPVEEMISRAATLARHLERYQKALASVALHNPADINRRLSALFCLAEPVEMPRQELLQLSGISASGLQKMAEIDLVKIRGSNVTLTRFGESFLALLYMFGKEVTGGTSEGYLDLINAASSGGYDPTFIAHLLIGSASRDAERLRAETSHENQTTLAARRAERDQASERVQRAIELLTRDLPADTQAGLRRAATDLHHATVSQRQVAARLTRENVSLPQGKRYSDLETLLQRHSWTSFLTMLDRHPALFTNIMEAPHRAVFGDELIHMFAARVPDSRVFQAATPVEGPAPPPEAIRLMVADLQQVNTDRPWHEIATSGRSFMCGVWYANARRLPPEARPLGIDLEWTDSRVSNPPFLDCPVIIVRRRT